MKEFQKMLSGLGLGQSMSRKGNCHDNAVMENFFGRLKVEMFYGEEKTFRYYEDFRKVLEEYMLWYNQKRIKEYLQWKSPIQVLSTSATL
ncbi:MAG: IS3 family transposase [Bacilli bacterium]|nr:IS3 family transposase [Bacilli bacterium]